MKIVCFCPDQIWDFKNYFFVEANKEEYELQIKPKLTTEHLEQMSNLFELDNPEDDEETYRVFLHYIPRHCDNDFEPAFHPAFKAWPHSGMNGLTRLFLNKQVKTIEEIRNFFRP